MAQIDLGCLFPKPMGKPVTVREAILQDGFVQYRAGFGQGGVNTVRRDFNAPSNTLTNQDTPQSSLYENETSVSTDLPAPRLSEKYVNYWLSAGIGGGVGKFNSSKRLDPSKPSFTISKAEGYGGMYHPGQPRGLSGGERKRVSSFPDAYKFTNWESSVERIGNSVPPLFMYAIAAQIRYTLWGG